MSNKAKIIDIIQKVLNKAGNNPSKEEAETAILMAQKLMLKHGISHADIEEATAEDEAVVEGMIFEGKKTDNAVAYLGSVIAANFRCKHFAKMLLHAVTKKQKCIQHYFLGEKCDVEIAQKVFKHALDLMRKLADEYILLFGKGFTFSFLEESSMPKEVDVRQKKNAFKLGFVGGLRRKFEEQVASECMALVVRPKETVEQAFEDMDCERRRKPVDKMIEEGAVHSYLAGHRAGNNYNYSAGEITKGES